MEVRSIITVYDILEHLPGREIGGDVPLTNDEAKKIEDYLGDYAV